MSPEPPGDQPAPVLARVVSAQPERVVDWSTAELAQAADVSPATVIRACRNLGFHGYQHLRLELARTSAAAEPERAGTDAATAAFDDAMDAMVAARAMLDRQAFDRAVQAVVGADRVLFVGTGFSAAPAQDAAMRLMTADRPAEAPADVMAQQFAAQTLAPGDVCVAVSYSGANVHTLHACQAAASRGATVIAVTCFVRSPLTRISDILLTTGPVRRAHEVDPFLGRLGQSVVLHALHQAVLTRPSAERVQRMREVVADALADDGPGDDS